MVSEGAARVSSYNFLHFRQANLREFRFIHDQFFGGQSPPLPPRAAPLHSMGVVIK